MIRIEELSKRFADVTAVNNVSLFIEKGTIYGLLGPNGAGKTTLINILCGLLPPTGGKVTIGNYDIRKNIHQIKEIIGVIPQDMAIYEDLSAYDNVKFFASLYGVRGQELKESVMNVLEFTGLKDAAKKYPRTFSGGMKRRLNIACGLAHNPEIIFMDEPTVGIDPQSRNHILESVKKLNKQGCTVIYTTHYMEEAESICSKIAIIDHGKIIAEGTNEELKSLIKDKSRFIVSMKTDYPVDTEKLSRIQGVLHVETLGNKVFIDNDRGVNNLTQIISYFIGNEIPVNNLELDVPNLEMVFLTLTGRKLRDH
ncbi:MAG: ABC transporter ATP-binding protein [Spirochaetales bacterium]|nr:ABC transporter ATP-binding protein [Spirochaetales bacterium]